MLKAGLRWRPRTGPWWPRKVLMITSGCTFAFLEQHTILPSSVPTWPHQNTTRNIPPVVPHHVSGGDGGVVLEDAGGEGPLPHPLAPGVLVIRVQDHSLHRGGEAAGVPPLRWSIQVCNKVYNMLSTLTVQSELAVMISLSVLLATHTVLQQGGILSAAGGDISTCRREPRAPARCPPLRLARAPPSCPTSPGRRCGSLLPPCATWGVSLLTAFQ